MHADRGPIVFDGGAKRFSRSSAVFGAIFIDLTFDRF
jgi:hypothetical protein